MRGRVSRFSSSEPCTITGCMPKIDRCIELAPFIPAPDAATSSSSSDASVMPKPCPPYSSGVVMPEPAAVGERLVELGRELVRRGPWSSSTGRRTCAASSATAWRIVA